MMTAGKKAVAFRPALVFTACAILLSVTGCKIVHDDQLAKSNPANASAFDAAGYVSGVWTDKVLPLYTDKATDLAVLLPAAQADLNAAGGKYGHRATSEGSTWSFAVKGKGKVVSVNTESRAGTIVVEVPAGNEAAKVTLQIGPIVKGNALRDGLPFFSFQDVTNQLEFAQVGRTLNEKAIERVKDVVPSVKADGTVSFSGAMTLPKAGDPIVVVPVTLKPESAP
jgi:predicted lipoprotein